MHISRIILSIMIIQSCTLLTHNGYEKEFKKACDYFHQGDHHHAKEYFIKTITINPQCYQAYYNLGLIHEHAKEYTQAIEYMLKALAIKPEYTNPLRSLGKMFYQTGKTQEAKYYYLKALSHETSQSQIHHQLGKIYFEETVLDRCIYHLEKARETDPENIHILLDLANTKNMLNETEQALKLYQEMNRILPDNPSILYNIAYTLKKLGRLTDAMPYYHNTLRIRPDHADAHFGYGLALLLTGHWEEGWKEYEWRWMRQGQSTFPHYKKPMWDGSDLHGKKIYLRAEQGLGDTFQFIRYVKIAKEKGGTTIVAMQPPLMQYMKHCPYIDVLISTHDTPPEFDVYAAFVSCPMILKTSLDNVPADIPYLHADEKLVAHWHDILCNDPHFKIGICWQGNPNYSTHFLRMAVAAKSMPLSYFVPLFDIPGTSFYSLQIKTGINQIAELPADARAKLTIFGDDFDVTHGSFMDSAAVIKNLDLVITVDTSVSHFAAALGTPTWLLLPEPPDWRWMLHGTTTPWYPNMKLFRQPNPGDWQTPMNAIAAELITLLEVK